MRPIQSRRNWQPGDLLAGLACVWVALGASYFGLYSCGSHGWKHDAFRHASWVLTFAAVVLPGHVLGNWPRRLLFPIALWAAYVLLESAVAPFYPAAPLTWREYVETFWSAMQHGPCR